MRTKKILLLMALIVFGIAMFFDIQVNAETTYESGDVDRIYITSPIEINQLNKENYSAAEVVVVKTDGTIDIEDSEAQVKLRGNSTSKAAKKPLKLKLSSKESFLGMDKGKKWNILANAFDKTLIRNRLCFDLGNKMGLSYISQGRFVDLYYNGKLNGSYYITEPVETGTGRVEINEDANDFMVEVERERYESDVKYLNTKNGVRFAINAPETPTDTQMIYINNYLKNVEAALKTYKASQYSQYIDVDSFVNYYIVCEIFKAVDFNYSSTRFYVKDGKMYAGPLWDVDLSSGNASSTFYKAYYSNGVSYKGLYCTEMKWYGYLIKSDEFLAKVNARVKQMLPVIENMYKTNSLGINQIDDLLNKYGASFQRNYQSENIGGAGWNITYRYSVCDNPKGLEYENHSNTYNGNVSMLRSWLSDRVNYLKSEWQNVINNKIEFLTADKKTYNSISLSWVNIGAADGCEIYYKVSGGTYKLLKKIENAQTQEYLAKKLKPGIKYYFQVRSYVQTGDTKQYSAFATVSKKIKLSSPKCKVKKISSKRRKVVWKKVKGANGYIVYSRTKKGKYKKAAVIKGNKNVQYIKKNCQKNKKYYFKVKAYVKYAGKKYISE